MGVSEIGVPYFGVPYYFGYYIRVPYFRKLPYRALTGTLPKETPQKFMEPYALRTLQAQGLQYPIMKEYTLNYSRILNMI